MSRLRACVVLAMGLIGCASHRSFDTASIPTPRPEAGPITVGKEGLSREQISAILATTPPPNRPVDLAIVLLQRGRVLASLEDAFSFAVVEQLKKSGKFQRITPLPDFIVPAALSFDAIQELGVRSLSDYVLVFHLDGDHVFEWTSLIASEFQIESAISFILVDSRTSAVLTADKLFSTQRYRGRLFELNETEKAQRQLFDEQAKLLSGKLDRLFPGGAPRATGEQPRKRIQDAAM